MIKRLSFMVLVAWLAAVTAVAAPLEPGLVAQVHFAGGDAVSADPNSAALKYLWTSPEALALRAQTLDKLARSLDGWLRQQIAPNLAGPLPLRALLGDMTAAEWQLELREPAPGEVAFALAVRLDNERAKQWQTDLTPLCKAWEAASPAHHAGIFLSRNWLLLQIGNTPMPNPSGSIPSLKSTWLAAEFDWSRLSQLFPDLVKLDLPQTRLLVSGRDGNFQVDAKFRLAQPLPAVGQWQIPAESIHSPLTSFTAARGISSWLSQQPWVVALGLAALPDQIFTWSTPAMPFQTYAAVPLPSAPAALPKINQALDTFFHGSTNSPYKGFRINATGDRIAVTGMPLISPYFEARRQVAGEFLMAGFFPAVVGGKPVPPDLLSQLNQPHLLYYDWDSTSARLKAFPELYQLLFVVSRHRQLDVASAAGKWLGQIGPSLGTTVTGATLTAPDEITLSRKARAGLTAAELVALASWLEAPNFPGCDLRLPPFKRIIRPHASAPGKVLGTNAPFPLHH